MAIRSIEKLMTADVPKEVNTELNRVIIWENIR